MIYFIYLFLETLYRNEHTGWQHANSKGLSRSWTWMWDRWWLKRNERLIDWSESRYFRVSCSIKFVEHWRIELSELFWDIVTVILEVTESLCLAVVGGINIPLKLGRLSHALRCRGHIVEPIRSLEITTSSGVVSAIIRLNREVQRFLVIYLRNIS